MNFLAVRLPLLMLAPFALMFYAAQSTPLQPQPTAIRPYEGFRVEVAGLGAVPVSTFDAANGADTHIRVATRVRQAPPHVRWFLNSRVVAIKDGKSRLLWDNSESVFERDPWVSSRGTTSTETRSDDFLFNLRDVPVAEGEIRFEWDTLVQPSQKTEASNSEFVSLAEMDRLTRPGDARLSRKLVLRRDGEKILKPTFAAKPPLRLLSVQLQPDPEGMFYDTRIVMRLAYEGDEAKPKIIAPEGLQLKDDKGQEIERGAEFEEEATREGQTRNYRITARAQSDDLKNVRFLSVEANLSDGKSWPTRFKGRVDLPPARE